MTRKRSGRLRRSVRHREGNGNDGHVASVFHPSGAAVVPWARPGYFASRGWKGRAHGTARLSRARGASVPTPCSNPSPSSLTRLAGSALGLLLLTPLALTRPARFRFVPSVFAAHVFLPHAYNSARGTSPRHGELSGTAQQQKAVLALSGETRADVRPCVRAHAFSLPACEPLSGAGVVAVERLARPRVEHAAPPSLTPIDDLRGRLPWGTWSRTARGRRRGHAGDAPGSAARAVGWPKAASARPCTRR